MQLFHCGGLGIVTVQRRLDSRVCRATGIARVVNENEQGCYFNPVMACWTLSGASIILLALGASAVQITQAGKGWHSGHA